MPTWFTTLLHPFQLAVAAVLAGAHHLAVSLGAAPGSGLAWLLAVIGLVITVRLALIPLTIRQVRLAHASARAKPALAEIQRRYAGRTDLDSRRAQLAELRAVRGEHGLSAWGALPLLIQVPVMLALFRVLRDVADGVGIGVMSAALVDSARSADVLGAGLGAHLTAVATWPDGAVIVAVALATAALTYLTSRYLVLANLPSPAPSGAQPGTDPAAQLAAQLSATMMRVMPTFAAIGIVASGWAVPLGVLLYWLISAIWTAGQQAVINRWAPTPGSPAHARRTTT
ncbi:MAG: membrane protein insertase YidC [Kineosporiaceae bacterium]